MMIVLSHQFLDAITRMEPFSKSGIADAEDVRGIAVSVSILRQCREDVRGNAVSVSILRQCRDYPQLLLHNFSSNGTQVKRSSEVIWCVKPVTSILQVFYKSLQAFYKYFTSL